MVGDTVVLTCLVGEKLPNFTMLTTKYSNMAVGQLDDIRLKNNKWGKGLSISLGKVGLSDAGDYTCEATWNESYYRIDTYVLDVTGK